MPIVRDPVCGREINTDEMEAVVGRIDAGAPEIDPARGTKRFHDGKWYYFDTLACRMKFVSRPDAYTKTSS